ncbi:MAG: FtsW/RodA/SpoVE family cell cycle protein [Lachnospiraceae bacterium]|nr:FtsW/RodA/SpoVE family cell cycle protein [Lachnospiraceae bacterium]
MLSWKDYRLRNLNIRLLLYTAILCYAGILFLTSATMLEGGNAVNKQMIGLVIGFAVMVVAAAFDYHLLVKLAIPIYGICLALLVLVLLIGQNYNNARRWILIANSFTFQPSELVKMGLVVFFAAYFSYWVKKEKLNHPLVILSSVGLAGICALLVYREPDLSTTLVILFSFLVIIYTSGISYKWIFGVLLGVAPVAVFVIIRLVWQANLILAGTPPESGTLIQNYQMNRILSWRYPELFPGLVYQSQNSIMAIGNGGLTGKGLFNTTLESVKNGNFLVEQDCDFIFAVIGEETGFAGSCIIILLFFLVTAECVYTAIRARDLEGRLICVGVGSIFAFQSFINMGVASGLLPNTGIPLPFISAGLSSLLSSFIGIGLVLNVGLQRKRD